MRLASTSICIAILSLAASGASAQVVPAQPGPPAPIGHRQPTVRDLPPDVAGQREPPETSPSQAQIAPGRGGGPPTLQVEPSCEAAGRGAVVLGRNKEACLADETTAQDTLKQNWSKYSAVDKTQCVGMAKTGGPASYVELLSCLEIMRDARNIQNGDPLENENEPVTVRRGRDSGRPVRTRRRHPT